MTGATEIFRLYVAPTLGVDDAYFKKNSVGNWIYIANSAYGGKVVTEGGKTRLDFQITDPDAPGLTGSATDTDNDQFPHALEVANGLSVGVKDNNVFTSSKFFAMQLYLDVFYREGDTSGIAYWQSRIDAGMTCSEVAVAFLDSPEFQAGT